LALADLERQQYLTRQPHSRRSIALTSNGIALAERWQLLVVVGRAKTPSLQALGAVS
jgi:hypothetical protein